MDSTSKTMILCGVAGALGFLLSYFAERRYKKAKKILERVKNAQTEPLTYALELAKEQPYEGIVSGNITSLDNQKVVYKESRPIKFCPYILFVRENIWDSSVVSSQFVLREDKNEIQITPNKKTRSFGLQREVNKNKTAVIAIQSVLIILNVMCKFEMDIGTAEYIAFDGQHISLFGTISYNLVNKTLVMGEVKFAFSGSKKDVVLHLGEIATSEWWKTRIIQSLTLGLIGVVGYYAIKKFRNWGKQKMREKAKRLLQGKMNHMNLPANLNDNFVCPICCDNIKNVIYKNCNHIAACLVCDEKLTSKLCPICRSPITGKVFIVFE